MLLCCRSLRRQRLGIDPSNATPPRQRLESRPEQCRRGASPVVGTAAPWAKLVALAGPTMSRVSPFIILPLCLPQCLRTLFHALLSAVCSPLVLNQRLCSGMGVPGAKPRSDDRFELRSQAGPCSTSSYIVTSRGRQGSVTRPLVRFWFLGGSRGLQGSYIDPTH